MKLPFLWGMWTYRNVISPLDGARCQMYPTCSAYATIAIRRHGPLIGGWLAADRLIHEGGARPPEFPLVSRFGRNWISDPVEGNDWMFRHGAAAPAATPEPAIASPSGGSAVPADGPGARALADRLAETDPWESVTEYRRAAFLSSNGSFGAQALVDGGWVAARSGHAADLARGADAGDPAFEEADRLFDDAERRAVVVGDPAIARRAEFGRAWAYLARGYDFEAQRRFELLGHDDDAEGAADARWLAAWSTFSADLDDGRPPKVAARAFRPFESDPVRGGDARGMISEVDRAPGPRSPQTAMILQLALPGAGYVYAGRPLIGAGSFLLNAAFLAGTWLAIRDGNYPLGGILLSLESGWYFGGAGGAAQSAVQRNERLRRDGQERWRRRFMGSVWPGGAAAAVLF